MHEPRVRRREGKRGRVTLLLKDPSRHVEEANLWGITIYPHVSKLQPVAFYADASEVYEQALGGPYRASADKWCMCSSPTWQSNSTS